MHVFEKVENLGNKWWGLLILFAVLIFIPLYGVLSGGRVFADGFSYFWKEQFFYFFKSAIVLGDSPLWNPYVFSGFPSFVTLTGGFFNPVVYIFIKLLSSQFAYHWLIYVNLVFGTFFTGLFLRKIGVGFLGALAGGLAFVSSQWFLISELPLLSSISYLPLIFWHILKLQESRSIKNSIFWALLLSLSIGLGWFSAHWHLFVEIIFSAFIFVIYLYFSERKILPPLFFLASVVAGSILGLIQLIPTFLYVSHSQRISGFSHWGASGGGVWPGDLLTFLFPYFDVPVLNSQPWIFYIGVAQFFFFLYVFKLDLKSKAGFFSFLAILSFIMSLEHSPLFWLLHHFPFISLLHSPQRWIFITVFSISILAGLGVERWQKEGFASNFKYILGGVKYLFGIILSFFFILTLSFWVWGETFFTIFRKYSFWLFGIFETGEGASQYTIFIKRVFYLIKESMFLGNAKVLIPALLFLIFIIIIHKNLNGLISAEKFNKFLPLFLSVNFILFASLHDSAVSSGFSKFVPETVKIIRESKQEGRILPLYANDVSFPEVTGGNARYIKEYDIIFSSSMLVPNSNVQYGLESAEILDEIASRRMMKILKYFRSLKSEEFDNLGALKPVLDFLGVRFILSPIKIDNFKNTKLLAQVVVTPIKIPIYIYENHGPRPRFYFAEFLEVMPENESAAFEKLKTISEDGLGVFVECPEYELGIKNYELGTNPCGEGGLKVDGKGKLEVETKKNTLSILKTKSETSQFLVFSENHLPGWKAYIDGQETYIYTVGSVYMGVIVPEEGHEIKFEFTYRTIVEEFFLGLREGIF